MSLSQLGNPTNGLLVAVGLFACVAQYPLGGSEVLGIRPNRALFLTLPDVTAKLVTPLHWHRES